MKSARGAAAARGRGTARARRRAGPGHPHAGPAVRARCAVITVSDTRGPGEDESGARAEALLEGAGHDVVARRWVRDERGAIRRAALGLLRRREVDLVIVTGGTGVGRRDVTPESLEPLYSKPLPGFGERFRARSESQVGSAAWLSRASAGIARGRLLVLLPGSPRAVTLGIEDCLLPELGHALRLIGRMPTPRE